MVSWRLIADPPRSGAWNMALDEALWQSAASGAAPPTLRFYRWTPPTVSLGRFQGADGIDHEERERLGIDLVQRPTGGRAVLHDREVTYSVTAPEQALGGRSVLGTYHRIQSALRRALAELGVPADLAPGEERGRAAHASCFAGASPADGMLRGRKLIGSAQARRRGALLQHGSLLIDQDAALWERLFGPGNRGMALAELMGGPPAEQVVCRALVRGFEAALGIVFTVGSYTPEEERAAHSLVAKYAAPIPRSLAPQPGEVA